MPSFYYEYKDVKKGSQLNPGDVIIANQAYGEIRVISNGFIHTSVGRRLFFPDHVYPVFERKESSSSCSDSVDTK